jgi:S-adenosylmethionine-diacylgycerolhomoserine-N-methlytransferase
MTAAIHTAQMNRIYRHQRHVYDATRKFYLLGRDLLIARLDVGPGNKVLEIGCGTGRNLIRAAEYYPEVRFFGIDVSTEMLTSAIETIERAGRVRQIRVAHADATAFDCGPLFAVVKFERIYLSYTLSMIPAWQLVLDRAIAMLAPGGELHIVDFGGQAGLPRWFRTALRRWLELFHVTPRDYLETALRSRAKKANATLTIERPYRDYAQYARFRLN